MKGKGSGEGEQKPRERKKMRVKIRNRLRSVYWQSSYLKLRAANKRGIAGMVSYLPMCLMIICWHLEDKKGKDIELRNKYQWEKSVSVEIYYSFSLNNTNVSFIFFIIVKKPIKKTKMTSWSHNKFCPCLYKAYSSVSFIDLKCCTKTGQHVPLLQWTWAQVYFESVPHTLYSILLHKPS